MKNSEVPRQAMRRAVQLCGGIDALSDALSVSTSSIEKWMSGEEEPPLPALMQAVGLLLEATSRRPPKSRPGDPSEGSRKDRKH
jgi:DNA-binding transcriptional regulator YiaG